MGRIGFATLRQFQIGSGVRILAAFRHQSTVAIDPNMRAPKFDTTRSVSHVALNDKEPGVSPMNLLLVAVGGCAATNIRLVLGKKKVDVKGISVAISGQRKAASTLALESTEPWETVHITFTIGVGGLGGLPAGLVAMESEMIRKVVDASVNKYCGVHKTLEGGVANITWEFELSPEN
ncbi:hypothetical protein HK100_001307 [Physocladia obscura]|uniref:OsmC-like protein n=1 Tax=Physocladia obscura TaxID=109957 RepID=A0AAD5SY39_9FUNG|nr:hypothetical protein HK100_001307 [Physocladia obscura]